MNPNNVEFRFDSDMRHFARFRLPDTLAGCDVYNSLVSPFDTCRHDQALCGNKLLLSKYL